MLIVAYGDANSFSFAERCFSIAIQLVRALMSCALIGGFELVYGHHNTNRSVYVALVEDAREYSKSRGLPKYLRNKILGYFDYFWRIQLGIMENNVISKLPIHFQTQCIDVLKAQVIAKVHFLTEESNNVIQNLATLLTSQVYLPLDWITKTTRVREMYFISRGRVVLVDKRDNIQFKLNQGDTFGEIALFVENGFAYKALAETFCELYQLNRDVFETVLDAFYVDPDAARAKKEEMRDAIEQRDHQLLKTQKLLGQMISLKQLLESHDRSTGKWTLPNSRFRMNWSVLYLGSLLYIATEVPYKLIFSNDQDVGDFLLNKLNYAAAITIELFHLIHIRFMSRDFAFEDKSSIITTAPVVDPDLIFARYKESGNFVWDVAAILPVALIGDLLPIHDGLYVNLLRVGRLLRLIRLRYFQEVLSEVLEAYRVSTSMQTVIYLSLFVVFVTHVAGCFWFLIAEFHVHGDADEHWTAEHLPLDKCLRDGAIHGNCTWWLYDSVHYPTNNEYPRSLFWSVMTLTSVGYGMIFPFTTVECVFAFVWFFLSSLINFGVIGAISSAIAQLMANENRTQDTLMLINRFMKFKGVSLNVQSDIRRYYKNQWVREKGVSEEVFLSVLPDNVQHEILTFLHANTLKHVSIFASTGDDCKQIIASIIRHETYQKGDIVLHAGDMGCDLYVLRSGNVELRIAMTPIRILHAGDCYGEPNFILEVPYKATVQAMDSTELSVLRRSEFEQIIKFFPDEWDNIYALALEAQAREDSHLIRMQANLKREKLVTLTQTTVTLYVQPPREIGVIPPQHPFRRGWNLLIGTAILYNLFMTVFRIAFYQHPSDSMMSVLWITNLFFDAVYYVDIYLNYWHFTVDLDGFTHFDLAESRAHYMKHFFLRDIISSLPLYYIGDANIMAWCRLPRLVRSLELAQMVSKMQLWLQERYVSAKLTAFLRLANLLVALVVVAHFTGAVFYLLGNPDASHETDGLVTEVEEWFAIDAVIHEYPHNAIVLYIRSFYWALTTITAMDYRDIHPTSNIETYYTCLACFAGFFFVGQVIGQLTSIIVHMDKEANEFDELIENFDEYARSQDLPLFLLERGHQYFEYLFECTRGMDADVIFSELPHSLRMKLFYDLYGHRLRGLALFHALDPATLASIAERLTPVLYLPHDNIIVEGGTGAAMYIMNQGRAEEYVRQSNLVVAAVHEGGVFGELAFFLPEMTHTTSVRAVTCCEVLRLEKADWIALWPDSRRIAMERAMLPDLKAKKAYMARATRNILMNLVATTKSSPHKKVRKQLMTNLRRMSTYGRARLSVFEKIKSSTVGGRESVSPGKLRSVYQIDKPRIQPVNEADKMTRKQSMVNAHGPKSSLKKSHAAIKSSKYLQDRLKSAQMLHTVGSFNDEDPLSWGAGGSRKVLPVDDEDGGDLTAEDVADVVVIDEKNANFEHLNYIRRMSNVANATQEASIDKASIWGEIKLPPKWTRPHSTFRRVWDLVMLVAVLYYSLAIPMRACFLRPELIPHNDTTVFAVWLGLEYVVDVAALADVIFRWNFFCQVIRGEASADVKLIRHHYRTKGGLWFDLIAAMPLEVLGLFVHEWTVAVSVWRFNKLFRLAHVSAWNASARDSVTLHFKSIAWVPRLWSFCQVCSIFLIAAHWAACIWVCVTVGDHDSATSQAYYVETAEVFVSPHDYHDVDLLHSAYVKAFYFAITSLTSITFGDIYSTSLVQTIVAIFIIFLALTAYGVLTGGLSEIFEVEFKNRVKFEEQTSTVSTFLVHRQFPRHLTIQILEYFRNMWEHSEGVVESQALAPLSSALREDIAVYVKRDLITKVHLFSECDQDFTRAIVSVLQAEFFVAKDVIIREGDYERSMYFIHSGFVLVTNIAKTYEVVKQKGDYFGEMSLLYNTPRSGSCSAISNCDMYILDHNSYEYVLERFPHYRERNLRTWCTGAPPTSTSSPPRSNEVPPADGSNVDVLHLQSMSDHESAPVLTPPTEEGDALMRRTSQMQITKAVVAFAARTHNIRESIAHAPLQRQSSKKLEPSHGVRRQSSAIANKLVSRGSYNRILDTTAAEAIPSAAPTAPAIVVNPVEANFIEPLSDPPARKILARGILPHVATTPEMDLRRRKISAVWEDVKASPRYMERLHSIEAMEATEAMDRPKTASSAVSTTAATAAKQTASLVVRQRALNHAAPGSGRRNSVETLTIRN
ncbi:unnamed protein product [Aphanomyces euteiches]